jgi:hypothetical protein
MVATKLKYYQIEKHLSTSWPLDGHIFLIERNKPLNGNAIKYKSIYPPSANTWEMNRLNNYYILD